MNTQSLRRSSLAAALMLGLVFVTPSLNAAEAYQPTTIEAYALDYVKTHDTDKELEAFVDSELGLPPGTERAAVLKNVKAMLALKAKNYGLGKRAFWDELKKQLGADGQTGTTPPVMQGGTTQTPPSPHTSGFDIDAITKINAPLREYGISLGAGFGVTKAGDSSASLAVVLARYNFLQTETTENWTRKNFQEAAAKRSKFTQATAREARPALLNFKDAPAPGNEAGPDKQFFTYFGPFFGRALNGNKVPFGTKMERPYLLGLGLGFGSGPEASSAVYVDLGTTISPTQGFQGAKPYIGMSFDAIVLGKLLPAFNQ